MDLEQKASTRPNYALLLTGPLRKLRSVDGGCSTLRPLHARKRKTIAPHTGIRTICRRRGLSRRARWGVVGGEAERPGVGRRVGQHYPVNALR